MTGPSTDGNGERRRWAPELIGNPECPLMHRWTLLSGRWGKLLIHRFMPDVEDPDVHDHPRSLLIFVLRGSYDDMVLCPSCGDQSGRTIWDETCKCVREGRAGLVLGQHMRVGMVVYRPAEHAHATHAGPKGAWTICLMGPVRRPWGFWRDGRWWPFRAYEQRFGFTRRCPADDRPTGAP